ncbi:IclR family transcriptional regulator [Cumulibacter manganitolerans]|uniref:IclR family transcriptional regulator n=1 Tax=Cumulibacter manganitolerans TaxID=1884992 RepID=UPI001E42C312|nr:IclR family transcriptional regulator [Cumulibacter manganitolerans]
MRKSGLDDTPETDTPAVKPTLVLSKVFQLLDAFTGEHTELTVGEIREATGFPATTCARLIQNLVDEGLLDRVNDRYRIGLGVLRWSAAALRGLDLVPRIQPVLEHLRDATGETAALNVRRGLDRVMVAIEPTRHSVIWQARVGQITPIYVGSGARAILAFSAAARRELETVPRYAYTASTLVDAADLDRALEETRRTGLAISRDELDRGVAGISAPVMLVDGTVSASIGIAGPASRFGEAEIAAHIPAVLDAGRRATASVGGTFPY